MKDEVNVKNIIFDENINGEVELDTNITEELKQEGSVRELVRYLQDMRKNLGLTPADKISIFISVFAPLDKIFENNKDFILKEARGKDIFIGEKHDEKPDLDKEILMGEGKILLGIKKY